MNFRFYGAVRRRPRRVGSNYDRISRSEYRRGGVFWPLSIAEIALPPERTSARERGYGLATLSLSILAKSAKLTPSLFRFLRRGRDLDKFGERARFYVLLEIDPETFLFSSRRSLSIRDRSILIRISWTHRRLLGAGEEK